MKVQLVFLKLDESKYILVLKHDRVYSEMLEFYKEMDIVVHPEETDLFISLEAYCFLKETLGSHVVSLSCQKLLEDCKKVIDFYSLKKTCKVSPFNLSHRLQPTLFVIYNILFKKTVVSYNLHVPQCYEDFALVGDFTKEFDTAKLFFHNKSWHNKEAVLRKVSAFKTLFDID